MRYLSREFLNRYTTQSILWPGILILFLTCDLHASQSHQQLTVNGKNVLLSVPESQQIEFLVEIPGARLFVFGPEQEILLGTKSSNLYRLKPPYKKPELLASIKNGATVHSVVYRSGYLYAAGTCAVFRSVYPATLPLQFEKYLDLPCRTGGHHTRTLVVSPDNQLLVSIGISGNCSDEYLDNSYPFEKRRGGIFKIDESLPRAALVPYASGLRNPIGLAFNGDELFATNAGSDNMGYELPPEVMVKTHAGSFHGMPWFQFYDGAFRDGLCAESPLPVVAGKARFPSALFDARSTPIGITFADKKLLNGLYADKALVAIHGSWGKPPGGGPADRRPPKIVEVILKQNALGHVRDVVSGFQRDNGSRFARPAGIENGPDGNLYFTSDGGDIEGLFRLTLKDKANARRPDKDRRQ